MTDWIRMIEAAYDFDEPDHGAWLGRLATEIGPSLRGSYVSASLFHLEGDELRVFAANDADPNYLSRSAASFAAVPDIHLRAFRGTPFNTMSHHVGDARMDEPGLRDTFAPLGVRDVLGLLARDGGPWGVCVSAALRRTRAIAAKTAAPFERVAAHVHAALRLRLRTFGAPTLAPVRESVRAVLSPGGKLVHVEREAVAFVGPMRRAAVSMDRARARQRRQAPDEALRAWRALVEGELSLVETFESDGRRFLVARHNPPQSIAASKLTLLEQRVVGLRARGHSVKLIAYELGLSSPTVSRRLANGLRKLRVSLRDLRDA